MVKTIIILSRQNGLVWARYLHIIFLKDFYVTGKVYTTAEIVLQGFSKQQPDGITFERKHDPATGFEELSVSPTCKAK